MTDNSSADRIWNRILWLALTPMLGVLGYASLYLIGLTYHETYLDHFNISPRLFPKSSTDLFIQAYLALLHIGISWIELVLNYKVWLYLAGLTLLLLIEMIILEKLPALIKRSQPTILEKYKFLKKALALLGISVLISTSFLLIPLAANIFLLAPAFIGIQGANISIKDSIEIYTTKCESAKKEFCVRLLDGDKEVAKGYVIAVSDNRIALILGDHTTIVPLLNHRIEKILPTKEQIKGSE